jgi:hypothetical protein
LRSSDDFPESDDLEAHREADRRDWQDFWDSPTLESWRRGGNPWS